MPTFPSFRRWSFILAALGALTGLAACGSDGGETPTDDDGAAGAGGGGCVPELEVCDGIDNNCDMQVDEGCNCTDGQTQGCYTGDPALVGIGACAEGSQTCDSSGSWDACNGEVLPGDEVCDGADNNCDGEADEGFGEVTCGLGICQVTIVECVNGSPQACIPGPAETETCNGLDDDCNGGIDEGCTCTDGQMQSCYSGPANTQGVGACSDGMQTCQNGQWGACIGQTTPATESCDGADNDCDGASDDGNPGGGVTCNTGLQGVCAAGTTNCSNGAISCVQTTMPSAEICDNLDNDCNGVADNGDPGGGADCSINGQLGICADGTLHCVGGNLSCTPDFPNAPISELCNGLDDDCDGTPDDGNPEGGGSCSTGLLGVCAAGLVQCGSGTLSCQQTTMAGTEVCNNSIDEDCDGTLNNGCPDCGNGVIAGTEQCDDGNTLSGDGCSGTCTLEPGSCCTGQPSSCISSPVGITFSNLALAIPDNSYDGTLATMGCINLAVDICAGTITDLDVQIAMDHTWIGDVTVKLISPANTTTTLMHRPGNPAANNGDSSNLLASSPINFDDAAAFDPELMGSTLTTSQVVCLDDGICNYFANPDGETGVNLADFNGEALFGTWTVCVGDSGLGDFGTLDSVVLGAAFN